MGTTTGLTGLEIAIIGMHGRFPGAKHVHEFWENLKNGKETISFFSDEELLETGVAQEILDNPDYVKAFGFLENNDCFDASFFEYTDTEAKIMDPQSRILHECAWSCLEDAGYYPGTYNGLIGLYVGAASNFTWEALTLFSPELNMSGEAASQLLMKRDLIAGWVSYKLDLKGPGFTLASACSTSLVAIHEACQAVLNGECDMALAGGVSVTSLNKTGYMYMEGLAASPDGHVRAFDAGPHGIVGGNGAAVVLLKRLEEALEDRDHIYAVIKGSAINNDGVQKAGFAAPSIEGQGRVIRAAMEMAEVKPESIGCIETHGTGTELGDPVEFQALKLAFNTNKLQYCAIGSLKTNIAHLSEAAGAAGLIKAALSVKHGLIPPSLNFKRPNPKIDFKNSPFYVNTELSKWKDGLSPRRAGVSALGLGGTNAHIILEEIPPPELSSQSRTFQLLMLSAKTPGALDRNTQDLASHLENNPGINLADAAYTLQTGRKGFQYRRMTVCSTREEAVRCLSSPQEENLQVRMITEKKRPLVFMFSGQGSLYVNMGLDLYNQEPQFREKIDQCFSILESLSGVNFKDILYPSPGKLQEAKKKMTDARYNGPITLSFEYSLAKLLMKWGLKPQAMVGYSFGEFTAACLSGVFLLEDLLKLTVRRGEMMLRMPVGSMMSVPLPEEELKQLLPADISIAAVNGPEFCIVSGPPQSIKRFRDELRAEGHDAYRFRVNRAGHSQMMVPFKEELITHFEDIQVDTPKIPYISGLSGTWITPEQAASPLYWAQHMTETIRFYDGVDQVIRELNPIFIQVGAERALPVYVGLHPHRKEESLALNLVRYDKEKSHDGAFLLEKIGKLWQFGLDINWSTFYENEKRSRIPLPTYSFERTAYPPRGDINKIIAELMSGKSMVDISSSPQDEGPADQLEETSLSPLKQKKKRTKLSTQYAPPGNELEEKLAEIFESFFEIEPVGIHDNFYELGGDSIKAAQLTNLIKKSGAGLTVSIKELLYSQNIHSICARLRQEEKIAARENNEKSSPISGENERTLKNEVSAEDLLLMEQEFKKVNRLSDLLKKNTLIREYEVSPVQATWLIPPFTLISTNSVYFPFKSYDFSYPLDHIKIRDIVAVLVQRNSLLRSLIIDKNGYYFIHEFDTFSNIQLPFIDISSYSAPCREKIIHRIHSYLIKPMNILGHPLFRAVILKVDYTHFKLIFQINHLIGDGTCVGILDKQLYTIRNGMEDPWEKSASKIDYYDYVQFLKNQNYDHTALNKYIKPRDYSRSNKAILKKLKVANNKSETFELDISGIDEKFKAYYNEILFFAYAKLIGDLFGVNKVPIEFVTNGRIYKGGNFSHIIGDFHDNLPVLFSLKNDPLAEIERFIEYKNFVKENNLNFMNYVAKGYISGLKDLILKSPFSFNALIGSSIFFSSDSYRKRVSERLDISSPYLVMSLLEDFSAGKLWISFIQNTGFTIKEIFMKNYSHLVNYLGKNKRRNTNE